ncbi:collagen-like protein [Salinimicrobium soli]|uniref:collagen-like protein n=1 Tax=Salinimicrobium soli TaxID=1254399 RepID=UPI003AAEE657
MKKIFYLLTLVSFTLASCSDEGPPGPPGEPGVNIVGQTFEFENVDFNYDGDFNLYSYFITIPAEIEVLPSDAILVYRREILDGAETWSLIPQNFFLDEGIIQYVYNHTDADIELIIDGNFDLSTLSTAWTDDQFFRFIVIPSDFALDTGVDVSDMNAVLSELEN